MPEYYAALTNDRGIALVVPDHDVKARRRAAAWVWLNHVTEEPYADHAAEFAELMRAAQPETWIVDTETDEPECKVAVFFFLLDDIPGSHAWSEEWALGDSPQDD